VITLAWSAFLSEVPVAEQMRVYYLDSPLSTGELLELEEMMRWTVEQVRVPLLLPEGRGSHHDQVVPESPLRAAGILKDYGRRCALVKLSAETVYWNTIFAEAIARLTGSWPFLVQTKTAREAIGTQGALRVLDLDGAMRDL
jgi:hypothetical protein